jgi:peptide/nickel transport system substrate-binding protein
MCMIITLTLSACGSDSKSETGGKTKKIINIGMMNAPSGFNPLESSDLAQNVCTAILFKPLVEFDETMKHVPMLADSIETQDNQTFTIKLNVNAKWTDGKPVTADDVIFTLDLISNPKVAATVASNFNILEGLDGNGKNISGASILGVKKIDDHTLAFKTKNPIDLALFKEGIGTKLKTMPAHVLKEIDPEKLYQSPFMQNPTVTDGPFKLVAYQKGQYVQFAANKDYFKGPPKLDELYFKIMPGANITAQLQSGEIDMNDANLGMIPFEDTDKVKAMSNVAADTSGIQSAIQTLMINVNTVQDVKVRQAISTAINRKMIIEDLLKGDGEGVEVPYLSSSPYVNKSILPLNAYDADKAKQLLQEAGWDANRTLNFNVPTGNKVREQVADIIADNLKSIGMKVQIQKYDFVTSMSKAKKGEYDIYIIGLTVYPATPDISHILKTGAPLNLAGYSNKEMDDLLIAGKSAVDPVMSKEIYNKIQELFARDLPCPGIYAQNALKAVSKRVKVGKPKSFGTYNDLELWDVEN